MTLSRLQIAIDHITAARDYTLTLLDEIPPDRWYEPVGNSVSHIAWQVGHLAMAEYGLTLFRIRGRQSADRDLMPSAFRKKFSRSTTPDFDVSSAIPAAEIRTVFDKVHEQALKEMAGYSEEQLEQPVDMPYFAYPNHYGGLMFCASHESLHAGQIGLARRLLGCEPVR